MIQKEEHELHNLPIELTEILHGYQSIKDSIGCSSARVYKFQKDGHALFLKIDTINEEMRREYEIIQWLHKKLPVPEIKHFSERDGLVYFLTEEVKGHMTCTCPADELEKPYEQTVCLLADGLLLLQAVDIADCPFQNTLDQKLSKALYNITHGLVDQNDWEAENSFKTPMDLYQYLLMNRPMEELYFTHGDYCLPNVFVDGKSITGFIDLGRAGIADKWQDIALCVRSLRYNLRKEEKREEYINLLFKHLKISPDWKKIEYYILLDELF